ncbi:MAG: hypothetical protein EP343_15990 [Deltaproteobacteria bacterium]|nr:MAG: hypothetical protein EP343_15990 [Deltaproteobacteria bacterium]
MRLTETVFLYGAVGVTCGIAFARQVDESPQARYLKASLSLLFWPLLFPLLLPRSVPRDVTWRKQWEKGPFHESIDSLLQSVNDALHQAEEHVSWPMERERNSMEKLSQHLYRWDGRIAELNGLLEQPDFNKEHAEALLVEREERGAKAPAESARIHLANVCKLHDLRGKLISSMEEALAMLERVRSQVTLLRFTGESSNEMKRDMEDILLLVDGWDDSLSSSLW